MPPGTTRRSSTLLLTPDDGWVRPRSWGFARARLTRTRQTRQAVRRLRSSRPSLLRLLPHPSPSSWCVRLPLSLIHISEPTRLRRISYAVFCLKKKKTKKTKQKKVFKQYKKKKKKKKKKKIK